MAIPQTLINLAKQQATQFSIILPGGEILPAAINPGQAATLDFRNGLLLPGNANPFAGTPLFDALVEYAKQQNVKPESQAEIHDRSTTIGEAIARSFERTEKVSIELKKEPFKPRYIFEKLTFYPHMGPQDEIIWNRFIEQNPNAYESMDYDTRVGLGEKIVDLEISEAGIKNAIQLSQKRIDAVGKRKDGIFDVIEVKPHAGSSAIGQILTNTDLFRADNEGFEVESAIITDRAQPDIFAIANKHEIKIIEVGFE